MADYTVEIDSEGISTYKRGDYWPGLQVGPVLVNDAPPAGALLRVRMIFVHQTTGTRFLIDSDADSDPDAPLVIDDAAAWEASVAPPTRFLDRPGKWKWDMEFYEAGKVGPLTFYKGTTDVLEDVR